MKFCNMTLAKQKWYLKHKKRLAKEKALYYRKNIIKEKLNQKKWRERNKEKLLKYQQEWSLKFHYGLSIEQHEKLLNSQHKKCAICNRKVKLCVDHDHKTGKVRGLVCHRCNTLLVVFDNKRLFKSMIKYIGANLK